MFFLCVRVFVAQAGPELTILPFLPVWELQAWVTKPSAPTALVGLLWQGRLDSWFLFPQIQAALGLGLPGQ